MNKNRIDILHVYAGTRGTMGLYLDEIFKTLNDKYSQDAVVSYHFPFPYGKKWFYKYTDLSTGNLLFKFKFLRNVIRYFELTLTLILTYLFIIKKNVKYVNYGLTSDLKVEYFFIKMLSLNKKVKVIITCHDVLPFGSDDSRILQKKIKKKKVFFDLADFLLVHNNNSLDDLNNFFGVYSNRILKFPFPVMDLNKLNYVKNNIKNEFILSDKFTVGMFGNLRKEKGVKTLIDAWDYFYNSNKNAQLIIAGHVPPGLNYDFSKIKNKSSIIIEEFISEEIYSKLIEECDIVILPYHRGTNSGIPSSIISKGTFVVASDIPMFKNNKLIANNCLFKSQDFNDLSNKIEWFYSKDEIELSRMREKNYSRLKNYLQTFNKEINLAFSFLN